MAASEQAILSEAPSIEVETVRAVDTVVEGAVREHARLVYRIAYSVLRNHHDAEDATQETFVRLLRHHRQRRPVEVRDLRGWLARTTWRLAIDRKRRPQALSIEDAAKAVRELRASGIGVDEVAAREQMMTLLDRLIEALPRDLRETLALSVADELSSPEIAEVLGIPEGSVRTRLARARQILREKLSAVLEGKHGR